MHVTSMRAIVTDVAWTAYRCLLDTTVSPTNRVRKCAENYNKRHDKFILKTEVIEVPFELLTRMGTRNHVVVGVRIHPGGGIILGWDISRPVKYRKYMACGRYFQRYSVGSRSDEAFRCQYCGDLLGFGNSYG